MSQVYDPNALSLQFGVQGLEPTAPMYNNFGLSLMPSGGAAGGAAGGWAGPSWLDKIVGWTDPQTKTQNAGWGGLALNAASTLGNIWMGMQQYGLAKDQLAFQKDAFNRNFEAQRKTINSQLEDRQRARVASNSAYESPSSYMQRNGI